MNKQVSYKPVIAYFLIALLWSTSIWVLLNPNVQEVLGLQLSRNWDWFGLMGPGLAAIIVSWYTRGSSGLKSLFKPLLKWQVSYKYYVFIYLGMFFFFCAATGFTIFFQPALDLKDLYWFWQKAKGPLSGYTGIIALAEFTIIYTLCEELGWRGFALPELSKHVKPLYAALIIGCIWTLWHIPLIYLYGSYLTVKTFLIYALFIINLSIIYAWLYFKTDRSLLMVGLFHGASDYFVAYFPMISSSMGQGANLYTVVIQSILAVMMIPYLLTVSPASIKQKY